VRAFAAEERECERYQSSTDKVAKANTYLGLHIGLFQGIVLLDDNSYIKYLNTH
jgi:ATP-binding cassette subfamily B (MDR/TAP) protein 8